MYTCLGCGNYDLSIINFLIWVAIIVIAPIAIVIGLCAFFSADTDGTFKGFYRENRGNRKGIRFLLIASYGAIYMYAYQWLHQMFSLPHGKITDGYLLTLLGPLVFIWWAFWFIFSIFIMTPILDILWIPVLLYTVIFELPASYLNEPNEGFYKVPETKTKRDPKGRFVKQ